MSTELVLSLLVYFVPSCQPINILFFFGASTYSHRIAVWPLVEALTDRGHSVTFLQPMKSMNPNPKVMEIVPNIFSETDGLIQPDLIEVRAKYGPIGSFYLSADLPNLGETVCDMTLNDQEVMKWINSSKYELVIMDALFNDCGLGLAYKWGAQTIIFATSSVFEWLPDAYGFPTESNWISNLHYGQDLPLSFFSRVISTLSFLYFRYTKVGMLFPAIEPLLREKLDIPDMPPLVELESNVSLILMNSHFSEELARSLPPFIVPVGGMHCSEKTERISFRMEDFINDGWKHGFIYISFGSAVNIATGHQDLIDIFFKAIRNSKIRFVWKWEGPRPAEMPRNVYTAPWMPQQAILAHPKIRGFITHGGLLSMQEALFNGVPMITFPIFAEQDYNSERIHRTKRGIRLEITTVTEVELRNAMNAILTDDTYSKNVKMVSVLFKDRPQTPLYTAVWWVEYILRHKDTSFLRPLSISQTWYQKRLLDVWAFLFGVILLIVSIVFFFIKIILSCCFGKYSKSAPVKGRKDKKN